MCVGVVCVTLCGYMGQSVYRKKVFCRYKGGGGCRVPPPPQSATDGEGAGGMPCVHHYVSFMYLMYTPIMYLLMKDFHSTLVHPQAYILR